MRLIWSHGKNSGPWGVKSLQLKEVAAQEGLEMEALDYQGVMDPDARVRMLVKHLRDSFDPVLLAGSSMGGYVSLVASREIEVQGVFVLAPALYLPGYHWIDFPWLHAPAWVVHGWRDEIVPVENIIRFGRVHRTQVHLFNDEHRLFDCLKQIKELFRQFLRHFLGQYLGEKGQAGNA